MPENFKVADFKEVKLTVAIDSMGKAKVYVLKENGVIDISGKEAYRENVKRKEGKGKDLVGYLDE